MLQRLSQDLQEDRYLWAHVRRFRSPIHADIWRDLHQTGGTILPYEGEWIMRLPGGGYVMDIQLPA